MVGNQILINDQLENHPELKLSDINGITKKQIIDVITSEYWKEWNRLIVRSEYPRIKVYGLGHFTLMYGKTKSFLRVLVNKIRSIRGKNPEEYLKEGTKSYAINKYHVEIFQKTWKQLDKYKKTVNERYFKENKRRIEKFGDKAILL